tara:strand:- start:1419 stop:2840 length:1422 start_codon:yes stop_codon:yes gene_type:complete
MVAVLGANSVSGVYEVSNSLRFNDDDSPYLSRTPSSASNRTTWTWSAWIKRSAISTSNYQTMWNAGSSSSDDIRLTITNNDQIIFGTDATNFFITSQRLRDVSAWYHIVLAFDTTQGTASDRAKLYINGSLVSNFSTDNRSSLSGSYAYNNTVGHALGRQATGGSAHYDGYMAEINFIDGQQLAQTQFGEFDDNGVWIPKEYTGTYGTNGFFLEFKQTGTSQNASGIGADTSGNDNHFAVTNFTATDITEDTCTNNFATFNSIIPVHSSMTLKEGNLQGLTANAYGNGVSNSWFSTIGVDQGKWYAEFKLIQNSSSEGGLVGVAYDLSKQQQGSSSSAYNFAQSIDEGWAYNMNGSWYNNGANAGFSTYTTNDIIGVALDLDNNKIYWSKNGTYQNSADPANNTNGISIDANEVYFFAISDTTLSNTFTYQANFGNPPFTISSGNNDGKYGNFEYAPPSGYYALCTKRLAEFG